MYYSLFHSRKNFKAFQLAGGIGEFYELEPPVGVNGHFICTTTSLWSSLIENYLENLELPSKAIYYFNLNLNIVNYVGKIYYKT